MAKDGNAYSIALANKHAALLRCKLRMLEATAELRGFSDNPTVQQVATLLAEAREKIDIELALDEHDK